MLISSSSETQNIWFSSYTPAPQNRLPEAGSTEDSVDISAKAREMYSKMIHKYDRGATTSAEAAQKGSPQQGGGGEGGETESLDDKIASLKSQLAALASQITGSVADAGVMSKMNALQAQISALEAQKNAAA